jgi:hypothetical protein
MGGVGAAVRAWAAPETRYAHSPAIEPGRAAAARLVRRVLRVMPHSELATPRISMEATTRIIASSHRARDECCQSAVTTCIECSKRLSMALPPAATPNGSEQFSPMRALRSI